ncbi:MAG: hypothetical protein ABW218_01315 [Casimicrobiaceae bacterium]
MPEPDEDGLPAPRAPISFFGGALLVFATTASLLAGNELNAAVIGHHDGTTASATWGWACDTANPEHRVTVVLTALVDGVLTEIGTATADRSRSDVAHAKACGATADANHGFVFTHYPQSVVDGRSHDIYAYARMPDGSLRLLSASPQNLSLVPRGIWDQGLIDGRWRTDYFDPATASAREPLLLDAGPDAQCWLSVPPFVGGGASPFGTGCLTSPTTYSVSNAASSDGSFDAPNFWVITANSEPAYLTPHNTGPPNQTDPISAPGAGLYAIAVLPDNESAAPSPKTAHLIINKRLDPHVHHDKGPFLSYGVQSDWGNGKGAVTVLRAGAPKMLRFAATLYDIAPDPVADHVNLAFVIVEAQWGGIKRWSYLRLLDRNYPINGRYSFNWNILQSFLFPGADIVFRDAHSVDSACREKIPGWNAVVPMMAPAQTFLTHGNAARRSYSLDLEQLFDCLSDEFLSPMPPSGPIQITGIHFAIEQDYRHDNYTWVAFDSIRLD